MNKVFLMCLKKEKNITSSLPELRSRIVPVNIYLLKANNRNTEKVWIYVKVNNKDPRMISVTSFCCHHYQLRTYFTPFFRFSIVNFEQVNFAGVHIYWTNSNFLLDNIAYSTNQILTAVVYLTYFSSVLRCI